jgi:hypothetical protein
MRGGDEPAPIGVERNVGNVAGMPAKAEDRSAVRDVEDVDFRADRAGEPTAIGIERNALDIIEVSARRGERLAGREIPNLDLRRMELVGDLTCQGKSPAIGAEAERSEIFAETLEHPDRPTGLCIPEPHGPIPARRGEEAAIRAEDDTPGELVIPLEPPHQSARCHVPNLGSSQTADSQLDTLS